MVKVKSGNTLIFGLTDENIKRLTDNQPIKFNLQEMGMDDINIFIIHGKDEQYFRDLFKDKINPEKTIIQDYKADKN